MKALKVTGALLVENGLAYVGTDIVKDTNTFRFGAEDYELPRGKVRLAEWNGCLTARISDVREAVEKVHAANEIKRADRWGHA